jgi:16S rRNA (cytosine967-C5)-methyltransferase
MHYSAQNKECISKILNDVFCQGVRADKAIRKSFRSSPKLSVKDRALIAETSYDILRKWRLLWACYDQEPSYTLESFQKILKIYSLLETADSASSEMGPEERSILERFRELQSIRKMRESVPDWIDELGEKELGDRWDSILTALNRKPNLVLRVNTLKISKEELVLMLSSQGIATSSIPWAKDALMLHDYMNVFQLEVFQKGYFEVQDAASQLVSEMLNVKPHMRVVDSCAGAGGKTLHLAALMRNRGKLIAMDSNEGKLQDLRRRCTRSGVDIVETRVITSSKTIKRLKKSADGLLLDVPCSGLGVMKRNPEIKWRLKPEELERLKSMQQWILVSNSRMLKKGGRLVYSTCSILPSEGEEQVQNFLQNHSDKFRLVEEKRLCPDRDGFDGFYIALLEKIA